MRRALFTLMLSLLTIAGAQAAERRVALVIGNAAYQHVPPLDNPANDARLMAETLQSLGFSLIGGKPVIDADKTTLERAIRSFGRELHGGAVGLFYYSGHGVQINGANYLIPVGANIAEELDAKFELVDAGLVLDAMANAHNRLNIMILDACRNNPFAGRGLRAVGGGLAQVTAPAGTVISYATQPGDFARDGQGKHSPFTDALAHAIQRPGQDLFATFNDVGLRVKEATAGQQQPWLATSPIEGQFYFVPGDSNDLQRARDEADELRRQAAAARADAARARAEADAAGAARAKAEAQAKSEAAALAKARSATPPAPPAGRGEIAMVVPPAPPSPPKETPRGFDGIWQASGREQVIPLVRGQAQDCSYNVELTVAGDQLQALVPVGRGPRIRLAATIAPDGTFKTAPGEYGAMLRGSFSGDSVAVVLRTSTCAELEGKGQRAPR